MPSGALAWVACESPGTTLGRPGYWPLLEGGVWVSGVLVATDGSGEHTSGVPLCTG